MQYPQLNINGTNGKVLLDEHIEAMTAVQEAISAVQKITCHGRDYQTIANPQAASDAFREHLARIAALDKVAKELAAIASNIADQLTARMK